MVNLKEKRKNGVHGTVRENTKLLIKKKMRLSNCLWPQFMTEDNLVKKKHIYGVNVSQ